MRIGYLTNKELHKYSNYSNEISELVDNGLHPTEALKKVAEKYSLTENEIKLLARTYNVSTTIYHYSSSDEEDKTKLFDLADASKVIEELYKVNNKKNETKPKFVINVHSVDKKASGESEEDNVQYWLKPDWSRDEVILNERNIIKKKIKNLDLLKEAQDKLHQYILQKKLEVLENTDKLISWSKNNPWSISQIICECDLRFDKPTSTHVNKALSGLPKSAQYFDKKLIFDAENPPFNFICKINDSLNNLEKGLELGNTINKLLKKAESEMTNFSIFNDEIKKKLSKEAADAKIKIEPRFMDSDKKEDKSESKSSKDQKEEKPKKPIFDSSAARKKIEERSLRISEDIGPDFKSLEEASKNLDILQLADEWVMSEPFSGFHPSQVYKAVFSVAKMVPGITEHPLLLRSLVLELLNNRTLPISALRDAQMALKNVSDMRKFDSRKTDFSDSEALFE